MDTTNLKQRLDEFRQAFDLKQPLDNVYFALKGLFEALSLEQVGLMNSNAELRQRTTMLETDVDDLAADIGALTARVTALEEGTEPPPPEPAPPKGRYAYISDGNWHDVDDFLGTPVALAMFIAAGKAEHVTHVQHSCHIWESAADRENVMEQGVVGTIAHWSALHNAHIYNAKQNTMNAVADLVTQINISGADDTLTILAAGPMETIWMAVDASLPERRQHVRLISHHWWNDNHAKTDHGGHSYDDIVALGVVGDHIGDQNVGLNGSYEQHHYLRDSADDKLSWLWDRAHVGPTVGGGWQPATFDCSDAGMVWYALFGDPHCNPTKMRDFFTAGGEPDPDPEPTGVLHGVNLAGAEFGYTKWPGKHGTDYIYPTASLDYYASKGVKLIRLPFLWERMQQNLYADLHQPELDLMLAFIRKANQLGMLVIPDMHNYARYKLKQHVIGSPEVPRAAFTDCWRKLAGALKHEGNIFAYGTMNEPHDMHNADKTQFYPWKVTAQATVNAIREVDMSTTILIPGDGWSGAMSWREHSNDLHINDIADNLIYEAHQYGDANNSGQYANSYDADKTHPNIIVDRLQPFFSWLAEHEYRGFIGEIGVPGNDSRWLEVLRRAYAVCTAAGVDTTYWSGGPWWGSYPLSIEPSGGVDKPQMGVLSEFLGGAQ